jgi:hypothetical protein
MSALSLPVNRPVGQALLVASPGNRARPLEILRDLGFASTEVDDPYAAMTELCRRPLVYRAVILSLASLYREELAIISSIRSRFPHVELWLAHTEGREAALAEAMRLGAAGLLAVDGLHRIATGPTAPASQPEIHAELASALVEVVHSEPAPADVHPHDDFGHDTDGPILTPDELRALLHEQSPVPPHDD